LFTFLRFAFFCRPRKIVWWSIAIFTARSLRPIDAKPATVFRIIYLSAIRTIFGLLIDIAKTINPLVDATNRIFAFDCRSAFLNDIGQDFAFGRLRTVVNT